MNLQLHSDPAWPAVPRQPGGSVCVRLQQPASAQDVNGGRPVAADNWLPFTLNSDHVVRHDARASVRRPHGWHQFRPGGRIFRRAKAVDEIGPSRESWKSGRTLRAMLDGQPFPILPEPRTSASDACPFVPKPTGNTPPTDGMIGPCPAASQEKLGCFLPPAARSPVSHCGEYRVVSPHPFGVAAVVSSIGAFPSAGAPFSHPSTA